MYEQLNYGFKPIVFPQNKFQLKISQSFNERNITLIADGIKKQADAGEDVVRVQKRKLWEEWIFKNLNKKVDDNAR